MNGYVETALAITAIVAPIILTLVVAGVLVFGLFKYHKQLGTAIAATCAWLAKAVSFIATGLYNNYTAIVKNIREKLFTRSAYFRYGILVCMIVSVIHGSHLFATLENIPVLNYLEIAVFDIGTYALVEGLIATRKKGYILASVAILVTIIAINSVSFIANLAYNVHYYDSSQFSNINVFSITINAKDFFPFLQSTPPLIIIVMCFVAELFLQTENEIEAKTFKDRLRNQKQRAIDKLEVTLEMESKKRDLKAQYKPKKEQAVQVAPQQPARQHQPVAWSFLGIVKVYQTATPVQDTETTKQITEAIQKMSVSIVHLEQHFNQIVLPGVQQSEQMYIDGSIPAQLPAPTTIQEVREDDKPTFKSASVNTHMHMHTDTPAATNKTHTHTHTPIQDSSNQDTNNAHMHMHMNNTTPLTQPATAHTTIDDNPITHTDMQIDTTLLPLMARYPGIGEWVGSPTVELEKVSQALSMPVADLRKHVNKTRGIQATKLNVNVVKVESLVEWMKRQPALVGEIK